MKFDPRSFVLGLLTVAVVSCAGEYAGPAKSTTVVGKGVLNAAVLKEKLTTATGNPPESLRESEAPGLYEAQWGSNFAYITADGEYAVFGDMINLNTQNEVTENRRKSARITALAELNADNTIEFAPASPKYTVTVFTDVDCGYCRMLHRQMPEYNAAGIAVRYVFFPRTGPGTDSWRKAQTVWCASDRKIALTNAKNTGDIQGSTDCASPLQRDWELGNKLGVRGTPMIVLPDGETVPGYVPPEQLSAKLAAMELKVSAKN